MINAAVWMRARAEMRRTISSMILLAVVLGLFGGAAVSAVAGGRRTATAYTRFLESQDGFHALVADFSMFLDLFWTPEFEWIADLPYVTRAARTTHYFTTHDAEVISPHDAGFGRDYSVERILEGRAADPSNPEEVVVPFSSANRSIARLGERFELEFNRPGFTGTVRIPVRLVGVVAGPGHFPPNDLIGDDLIATPAFHRKYRGALAATDAMAVWLEGGPATTARLRADLDARSGDKVVQLFDMAAQARNVNRSFELEASALWVVGGFLGLAVALVFAQALLRHVTGSSNDAPALRALGMTRRQFLAVVAIRIAGVVGAGAALAMATALAISPVFPRGMARIAEPSPGFDLDLAAFALAFPAIVVLVLLAVLVPVARSVRGSRERTDGAGRARPSRLAAVLARAGMSPTATAGARMAMESGTGSSSVPVRATLSATALSIVAICIAFTFGASLQHLLDTPRLTGKYWDVSYGFDALDGAIKNLPGARAFPGVAAAEVGTTGIGMDVDDVSAVALVVQGPTFSTVLPPQRGRYPVGHEVLVGPRTLRALGKRVGDQVTVGLPGAPGRRMTIVGVGVLPPMSEQSQLGEGVLLEYATVSELFADIPPPDELFVRFSTEVDPTDHAEKLRAALIEPSDDFETHSPRDLLNLGRVDALPAVVSVLLGTLGAAIVAHMLVMAVRRRRRDLAILKTIGFVRAQVRRTVAWQSTILVGAALLAAIPLGVAIGRWLWASLATQLGVVVEPAFDVPAVLAIVPAALVLANLVAAFPARAAARTQPAAVLRSE